MAITSLDGYIASAKQHIVWAKSATRTTVAGVPFTVFDIAGNPGAGTLAIGNTTSGTVPTDAVAGYPVIAAINQIGYITRVDAGWSVAGRILVFDRLFAAGAYSFNADVTLASQPSYASRVPGGNYSGLELWVEAVTAFTGTPSFQINYVDEGGASGDTGVVAAPAALTLGRCYQLPLASGDSGVQRIDRVRCTVATAGSFNVMVLRRLVTIPVLLAGASNVLDLLGTGMPRIYADSALYVLLQATGTSSGIPEVSIEIADG